MTAITKARTFEYELFTCLGTSNGFILFRSESGRCKKWKAEDTEWITKGQKILIEL